MELFSQGRTGNEKAEEVLIPLANAELKGMLTIPTSADGIVLFAQGGASSHLNPRKRFVAEKFNEHRHATLLFDLLTKEEEALDASSGELRFDIGLLSERLIQATDWVTDSPKSRGLSVGYWGAGTGAAAALVAASRRPEVVHAVVLRGGRPDLAGPALEKVRVPTLFIVGAADNAVNPLNQEAFTKLRGVKKWELVPGATHLFVEPGTLEVAARFATSWFDFYLRDGKHHSLRTG